MLLFAHFLQIRFDADVTENISLIFDLVFHVELVSLHLFQQVRDKSSKYTDGKESSVCRIVDGNSSCRNTTLGTKLVRCCSSGVDRVD